MKTPEQYRREKLIRLTPQTAAQDGTRLELWVVPEDARRVKRGYPWEATVTDFATDTMYHLVGASCGLPMRLCDAVAYPVHRERLTAAYDN